MRKNIYTFTQSAPNHPSYVSINREENGNISLTVRSEHQGNFPSICGPTGYIELSVEEFNKLSATCLMFATNNMIGDEKL